MSTRSYKTKDLRNCVIYGYGEKGVRTLPNYDLRDANLRDAVFLGGDLRKCDFTDADISRAAFRSCIIAFDQLGVTKKFKTGWLWEMRFSGVRLEGKVDFSGKNLTGTQLLCRLPHADFEGANITRCTFGSAMPTARLCTTKNYREGNLSGITFLKTDLSGCDLSRQNLTGCRFGKCDFTGAVFDDAVITDADLGVGYGPHAGLTIDQIKSTWNYKHGRMDGITLPERIAKALQQEQQADR